MNKLLRFSIPFILAFLFLGMLFYLLGASNRASAAPSPSSTESTILVTTSDDESNTNGFCSLREAIQAANTNTSVDTCSSGNAVITDTISFDVMGTITVASQLSVTAGGPLMIDGGEIITISGDNSVRIFYNTSADLILESLFLISGFANDGGGIYNLGVLSITNCTLSGNSSTDYGGAIYNEGTLTMSNSTLSGNNGFAGGAIRNVWGVITVANSDLSGNSGYWGGAISNGGTLTVASSTLFGNSAYGGGAIYNEREGNLTVTNSSLSGNSAQFGGGINNENMSLVVNSTLTGNNAVSGGGGIYNYGTLAVINSTLSENFGHNGGGLSNNGNAEIIRSAIIDNHTGYDESTSGGGIDNWQTGTLNITNSTLSGNDATEGGAIANVQSGRLELTNSTVSGNNANEGGAIYNSSTLTATNTILANSLVGSDCSAPITDSGYNLSSDGSCGFDSANGSMPNTNPLLGALQDNGGPTWTHALLWNSPAIDSGDDSRCPSTDQRGVLRPLDGNNDGIAICDIGAYEREYQPLIFLPLVIK